MRLLVATDNDCDIWAYQSLDDEYEVLSIPQGKKALQHTYEHYWMYFTLREPFNSALRRGTTGLWRDDRQFVGYETDTLIHYYFLVKGLVTHFRSSLNSLEEFEWAVKSIAHGAPLNNVLFDYRHGRYAEKMRAVQETGTSRYTLPSATAVSAATNHSTTLV
jgi:hypothetical protein